MYNTLQINNILPKVILNIIVEYASEYIFIDFVKKKKKKINWGNLSYNKNAIHILEKNLDKVDWRELSGNEGAIHILEKNLDKVDWRELSGNEGAIHILEKKYK